MSSSKEIQSTALGKAIFDFIEAPPFHQRMYPDLYAEQLAEHLRSIEGLNHV